MNDLRIKELCKQKGLTQSELAERIGISRVGLSKAINGNTTIGTLEKIAGALGVEVSAFFTTPAEGVITCPHCGKSIHIKAEGE